MIMYAHCLKNELLSLYTPEFSRKPGLYSREDRANAQAMTREFQNRKNGLNVTRKE